MRTSVSITMFLCSLILLSTITSAQITFTADNLSAAYMMRYIAKNIVFSGLADKCTLNISYAIGKASPESFAINLHGTGKIDENKLEIKIKEIFDLTPKNIISTLNLRRPVYLKTASYGHFGRHGEEFTWEQTDKADELRMLI